MGNDYYILEDGEQKGPFTFDELTDMGLDIHTRVLSPLADGWQDACDLPEFFRYFEAQGVYFPTEDNLASFWWRLLAYIIDTVILTVLFEYVLRIFTYYGKTFNIQSINDLVTISLIYSLMLVIYNTIGDVSAMKGTVGQKFCKLVVVDADGLGLSLSKAILRSMAKVLSINILYLGFLSIFFSEHRQAMHDSIAKSYVVKRD
ncbi:MAG TPA: RDD family protein [Mucilaginibacter sp.]|jgi:uncharacterized RDD family membrane protein YckC